MSKEIKAQVVVLGSGPAGYSAAFRCADLGLETVLVERYSTLGGVCLNVGCIPSKALLHVSKVIEEAKAMADHGVVFGKPETDINKIRIWKEKVVNQLTGGLSGMAKQRKVTVVNGYGKFTGPNSIAVEGEGETTVVNFDNAIIAAGSRPIKLPFIPHEDPRIWDSTDALELNEVPGKLLIMGGGIIGLEMGTVYHSLGSQVDVVGQPMLAHKGVHEGHVAAEVISGKKHYFDPKVIPSIAYTEPEVAWVGKTEKEAKAEGINYEVATFPWAASGRAIASDCADGMTKMIFDKDTHRVIGGAIVGTNGGELLGEIGLAIEMGCDAEDIALTIHAHPTLHESVGLAAEVFEGSITDLPNKKAVKKKK
jgi:pyruvate/2-oxoglutarate dehydrogenase complex dihydrolipoamide dehydrogenase (E3) component